MKEINTKVNTKINTKVNICGVEFKNPVIAASGTFGFGREYEAFYDVSVLGGISTKGLTLQRREGNDPPRIAETPSGILNSVGLQNPGVDAFIERDLPWLRSKNTVVIANVAGSTVQDYRESARRLSDARVDMIELNISCPNVKQGGIAFGVYPDTIAEIVSAVRKAAGVPLMVKLSPNAADIAANALAAEGAGADCISLINTLGGMAVDIYARKPVLANVYGGLSGPAVKPVALKMCHQVCKAVKIPVIGMGGIASPTDILEFMMAGASAVMVGTQNIRDPMAGQTLVNGLTNLMCACKIMDVSEIIGII